MRIRNRLAIGAAVVIAGSAAVVKVATDEDDVPTTQPGVLRVDDGEGVHFVMTAGDYTTVEVVP